MADRKRNTLVFIALIVGASGLGIGGYSFIALRQHNSTNPNLLAVWETITGNGDNFYLNFSENQLNNSEYFSLSDGNTSILLTQMGWYRFTFTFTLNGLDPTNYYQLIIEKNGGSEIAPFYLDDPQTTYWTVNAIAYIFSDGDDVFKFRCHTSFDTFSIGSNQYYNQIVLEYVEGV